MTCNASACLSCVEGYAPVNGSCTACGDNEFSSHSMCIREQSRVHAAMLRCSRRTYTHDRARSVHAWLLELPPLHLAWLHGVRGEPHPDGWTVLGARHMLAWRRCRQWRLHLWVTRACALRSVTARRTRIVRSLLVALFVLRHLHYDQMPAMQRRIHARGQFLQSGYSTLPPGGSSH